MILSALSIRRPVFAWMLMLALILFGTLSFQHLGVSQLPEATNPVLTIDVSWVGAAPLLMETQIVDPIEEAIISVEGLQDVESDIRQGTASIKLTFATGKDIDAALQETNSKLRSVSLPNDVQEPTIDRINTDDNPIMWLDVSSTKRSFHDLINYIDLNLRSRFQSIPGVSNVILGGWQDQNLRVWVDNKKLLQYQLTILDIKNALMNENTEVAAGYLENEFTQINVRTMGEGVTPQEVGRMRITTRGGQPINSSNIRLEDVATIEDGLADQRDFVRTDGAASIGLGIRKAHGQNEVAVAAEVKAFIVQANRELAQLAPDIHITISFDSTRFTSESINETEFTLILAVVITGLVCWIFLGSWSSTFNVLLSIPTSILGTFIVMDALGFTLNFFTLLGLSLAVGIVVDDSIMVLENIVRHFHMGKTARQAALDGAREITFAALAATLAVVSIFFPVLLIPGFVGTLLFQFGATLSVAVLISLLEAITLTPMRCSQFMTRRQDESWIARQMNFLLEKSSRLYRRVLEHALNFRWLVVLGSLALFGLSLGSISLVRKEFLPKTDVATILLEFQTPVGSSLGYTMEQAKKLEGILRNHPMIDHYLINAGGFDGGQTNKGICFMMLKPIAERRKIHAQLLSRGQNVPASQFAITDQFREICRKLYPHKELDPQFIDLSSDFGGAKRGTNVEISVSGPSYAVLKERTDEMIRLFKASGLMTDIDTDYRDGVTELEVVPDRQEAIADGVSVADITDTVNAAIGGVREGKFTNDDRRYDVRLRLLPSQWSRPEDIAQLLVRNQYGELIPLAAVARITQEKKLLTITREMRQHAINIYANMATGKSLTDVMLFARKTAKALLPDNYHMTEVGASKDASSGASYALFLFFSSVFCLYAILAVQFNSFTHPFSIMIVLVFTITGALFGLLLTNNSINLYSMIGIIVLLGIATKNSILLVEFFNKQRFEHQLPVREAILKGAPIRLRPILMTSAATLFSMVPLAFGIGPGAEVRAPLGVVVIGGIFVSTLFSLIVVPCLYSLLVPWEVDQYKAHRELEGQANRV